MICPHCQLPLTVVNRSQQPLSSNGSVDCTTSCTSCKAILRIQITTLREPTKVVTTKKKKAETYCKVCQAVVLVGEESTHTCSVNRKEEEK